MKKKRLVLGACAAVAGLSLVVGVCARRGVRVPPEQKTCQRDDDCALLRTRCWSCCQDIDDSEAVNIRYAKLYETLGQCSEAHKKACGVPECFMMSYPAATCRASTCTVVIQSRPALNP